MVEQLKQTLNQLINNPNQLQFGTGVLISYVKYNYPKEIELNQLADKLKESNSKNVQP